MIVYFFKNAFEAFRYNRFRTFLTGLGVFVGVASVIIIITFSNSFSHYLSNEYTQKTTLGLVDGVGGVDDFDAIMKSVEIEMAVDEIKNRSDVISFERTGGVKTIACLVNDDVKCGNVTISFDDDVTVTKGRSFKECNGNVAIAYYTEDETIIAGYSISDKIAIDNIVYEIVGLTHDFTSELYFPTRLSADVHYDENNDLASFSLVADGQNPDTVKEVLDTLNSSLNGTARFADYTQSTNESIEDIFSSISLLLSAIASISLIVSAINIVNILHIAVLERTNEIAVYRSMGATKMMIVYIFLVESFLIVTIFSIAGYVFGLLISYIVLAFIGVGLFIDVSGLIFILSISILLGVVAGISPALKAANTNLSILLR